MRRRGQREIRRGEKKAEGRSRVRRETKKQVVTMFHCMPPETAAACVYNAVSFIHIQMISKNRAPAKNKKYKNDRV